MDQLIGSYDYYEDVISDFCVTLMNGFNNNLIAFANRPSKLEYLQSLEIPLELEVGNEVLLLTEHPEIILANDGFQIPFDQAIRYFPYLKDVGFWIEEKWSGYNGTDFKKLLSTYLYN
jgi:hypothetical protein